MFSLKIYPVLPLFLLFCFVGNFFSAQAQLMPVCVSDEMLQEKRKDPTYVLEEKKTNAAIRDIILSGDQVFNSTTLYTIPVVFHIITANPKAITDKMVADALNGLNDAFAHRSPYDGDPGGVDTKIQFCLARTRPDGGITSGIDRATTYYGQHDMNMEGDKPGALLDWDRSKYINIWVVDAIQAEIMQKFKCGAWSRMGVGGYAGAGSGLVVAGLGGPLLAHEMGHYLSLLHTFAAMDCRNTDCTTDGDLVCDTPPDASTDASPCANPENSCNTDVLSGPFLKDTTDNISNFMDYGSPCPSVFTQGQADRMRAFLQVFNSGSLIASNKCTIPCAENINASFDWDSNPFPKAGDNVTFNNTTTGASSFKWFLNNALVGTSNNITLNFPSIGKQTIKLIAYNRNENCFSSYEGNIYVDCGVVSRFSPAKRLIASEETIYPDSVFFWNKSYGADSYQWFISDHNGLNYSLKSISKDYTYKFPRAGNYKIKLVANKGTCYDTSRVFTMPVLDPRPDGIIRIYELDCYKNDSIRIVFGLYNAGYDTIPAGMKINFYDRQPNLPGKELLTPSLVTDKWVLGKCEQLFVHIVKANQLRLDEVGVVFDEDNLVDEVNESNNNAFRTTFQPKLTISPMDTLVYSNSTVSLRLTITPNTAKNIIWTAPVSASCQNCLTPDFRIVDTSIVKVNTISRWGCMDSIFSTINVYPIDIKIEDKKLYCHPNDSLSIESTICLGNGYDRLKKDVEVIYYDGDTLNSGVTLLGRSIIPAKTIFSSGCADVTHLLKASKTGKVYAYINGSQVLYETDLGNNYYQIGFIPFKIHLGSNPIDVMRGEPTPIPITISGGPYKAIRWTPSTSLNCADCPNPVITATTNTKIKVVANTENRCVDSALLNVNVYYQRHIILPNVFTPDGDGRNDYFYVVSGKDVLSVLQFQIFNRWGEKVFEKTNVRPNEYSGGWDGNYKGQKAPAGTYVYLIKVQIEGGGTEMIKGNITIIR